MAFNFKLGKCQNKCYPYNPNLIGFCRRKLDSLKHVCLLYLLTMNFLFQEYIDGIKKYFS